MSDIERCQECGSFGEQCASDTPVNGCGCQRCLYARLQVVEAELLKTKKMLSDVMIRLDWEMGVFPKVNDLTHKVMTEAGLLITEEDEPCPNHPMYPRRNCCQG
jgi:hypothetical protein